MFTIAPDGRGRWNLFMDSECLGNYVSAESAADDVFMCATGCWEWDEQGSVSHPCDLGEWTRIR
ncbi:MAG: hypothetical protein LBV80_00585 [Deltaproteobacteria bacterium]|nr:hypothetical protein [Deltaproteobacteria bacterium]